MEEGKRGPMLVLDRERAVRVGLGEVYSPSALLHGLELAASVRVNRIGMLLQGRSVISTNFLRFRNRRPRSPPLLFPTGAPLTARRKQPSDGQRWGETLNVCINTVSTEGGEP